MINWHLSKQGVRWPVPTWPYRWLRYRPIVFEHFLRLSADKLLVSKWSQAQVQFFKINKKLVVLTSCTNNILISNWPRTRKFSQFLQEGKPWIKIKILTHHGHPWSRSTSNFYALIGQNLTGEFMRKTYAVSRNLFTDSWNWQSFVLSCDVFNCLFPLVVQNEIQVLSRFFCHSWLVCLLGFWLRNAPPVKVIRNLISHGDVFVFHLSWYVRGLKSLKRFRPY